MSGIIAVYGLVISVLIAGAMDPSGHMSLYTYVLRARWMLETGHKLTLHRGFMHLAAGMSVGLTGVAAGYTIGIVGDAVSIIRAAR
jgi:V-type H+-transporting ATPase proteolipid subunit